MSSIVFKVAAWICFVLGIGLAWIELTYDPIKGPSWFSAIFWLIVMWVAWFFLLRAALNREKRGD